MSGERCIYIPPPPFQMFVTTYIYNDTDSVCYGHKSVLHIVRQTFCGESRFCIKVSVPNSCMTLQFGTRAIRDYKAITFQKFPTQDQRQSRNPASEAAIIDS